MPEPLVITPGDMPSSLNVVGERITVLASGAQTGSYEIFLQTGPEGSGPPAHSHPWDEAFYVIRGELLFGIGDMQATAIPGTLVHVPAGTLHWFRFGKRGGAMLSMTSREGAARMFADIDREIPPESPSLGTLITIGRRYGLSVPGVPE